MFSLTATITDPHVDEIDVTGTVDPATGVTRSTRFVTIHTTLTPTIDASNLPLFAGSWQSIQANGGEISSLTGIQAYEYNGNAFVLTFDTDANATSAVTNLITAFTTDGTLTATYLATRETFNRLDAEHRIHVGSKTTTTAVLATPITLPDGLTIRAGENVQDIFLIDNH